MISKTVCLFLLLLLLSACGISANGRDRLGSGARPTPIPTAVAATRPTYTVAQGDVIYEMDLRGRVTYVVEQSLSFAQDGIISQVHVQPGDLVTAGDPIADLDTTELEGERLLAQSALDIAQFKLASSQQEIDLARQRAQMRRDLAQVDLAFAIAQAGDTPSIEQQHQIDRLTILLNLAQLDLDELSAIVDPELAAIVDEAALRVAEIDNRLAAAFLTAPFDGKISAMNVSPGYAVATGEAVGAVADPAQIEATATIRESRLQELAEDMGVQITASNRPEQFLSGTISHLPDSFGAEAGDGNPLILIKFDEMESALELYEPGDRIAVSILVTERNDVLWLPPAAIRDFNGRKFVVVQDGAAQQRLDVILGIEGNGRVEIAEGLEAGQIIVGQ